MTQTRAVPNSDLKYSAK